MFIFTLSLFGYCVILIFVCFNHLLNIESMMLSDETFPKELFLEDCEENNHQEKQLAENEINVKFSLNYVNSKSIDNFTSYLSTSGNDDENESANSMEMERLIKSSDFDSNMAESIKFEEFDLHHQETSYKSINASSSHILKLPPPRAPIKKKKSISCHDLHSKKNNYDHVESKVKKLIENLREDRRRKTLMRHTSMPVCPQTMTIDEKSSDEEYDSNNLKRELRKKSIKIYELEEKCDMKDNQIYALECERSKMKMTFDKLRIEMQELKEIEKQYKQLKSLTSPNKTLKNAQIQTEDSGFIDESSKFHLTTTTTYINSHQKNVNRLLTGAAAIRQLAFDNTDTTMSHSHFSEINNLSSDNLIPESDPFMEEIDLPNMGKKDQDTNSVQKKKTKKIKLKRFFKFVPCISRNK
ncbi:hypothetical protein PVAND_007481 [Polypedilum vanderplanki]|uniref:Uncharacterized protein n=1 Tax=Polypedilum vanderplanki TaxID=319348 RepID=A0A9J6C7X9_POLVA|nr:hypothetical protein PVAND_007481 [Polypedilum vanderplanki]